jgi:hypothetical protein
MPQNTYSQKVAAIFEGVCYALLVPTSLSVIYSVLLMLVGLFAGSAEAVLYGFLYLLVVGIGVYLLVGYAKHRRGRLPGKKVLNLWKATAVYNFLLLLPWLTAAAFAIQESPASGSNEKRYAALVSIAVVSVYSAAIYFALKAYSLEKRKNLY